MAKYLGINKRFPALKKARMITLDGIDALGQIDFSGEL